MRLALAFLVALVATSPAWALTPAQRTLLLARPVPQFVEATFGGNLGPSSTISATVAAAFSSNQSVIGAVQFSTSGSCFAANITSFSDGIKTWSPAAVLYNHIVDTSNNQCGEMFLLPGVTPGKNTITVTFPSSLSFLVLGYQVVANISDSVADSSNAAIQQNVSSNPVSSGSVSVSPGAYIYTINMATNLAPSSKSVPLLGILANNDAADGFFDAYEIGGGGAVSGQWNVGSTGANFNYYTGIIVVH